MDSYETAEDDRIKREYSAIAKKMLESEERKMRREFCYRMKLTWGELIEELLDEKCELEARWDEELRILKESNGKELEHLRESLEAEHVRNMAELQSWYESQNSVIEPVEVVSARTEEMDRDEDGDPSYVAQQICEIDKELREQKKELFVYKNRLKHVLTSYIEFIQSKLQGRPKLLREQLASARSLMKKANEIETASVAEYVERGTRCARNRY